MKQGLGTAVGGFPALFYFKPFFQFPDLWQLFTFSNHCFYEKQLNIVYDMFDSIFVKWYHQGKKKRNCGEFPH